MSTGTQIAPTPILPVAPRISGRRRLHKLGWNVLGVIVLVVMVFPVYWMVATAFKPGQKILSYTLRAATAELGSPRRQTRPTASSDAGKYFSQVSGSYPVMTTAT